MTDEPLTPERPGLDHLKGIQQDMIIFLEGLLGRWGFMGPQKQLMKWLLGPSHLKLTLVLVHLVLRVPMCLTASATGCEFPPGNACGRQAQIVTTAMQRQGQARRLGFECVLCRCSARGGIVGQKLRGQRSEAAGLVKARSEGQGFSSRCSCWIWAALGKLWLDDVPS